MLENIQRGYFLLEGSVFCRGGGEARGRGGAGSATYEGEFFGVFFLSLGRKV